MTPLHWLAYWGDHRAVRVLLYKNQIDFIDINKGCCAPSRDQFIRKNGAFNAFMAKN